MARKKILIVAGEPSGDLHASNLIRDLKELQPDIEVFGIGGELCRGAGVDIVFDITKLALIGAVEVIKNITVVNQAHDAVIARITRERPDLAILVDYPGFNLKLARDLAKRSIPIAYYISPQLWAWGRQRVHLVKKYVTKMVVFFDFEKKLYRGYGVEAAFVGHPLLDIVRTTKTRDEALAHYGLTKDTLTVALLPGSRESELKVIMPVLAKAATIIAGKIPRVQFLVSKHPDRPASMYERALQGASFRYAIAESDMHNIVGAADLAIVTSGTATLETTIIGTPFVLVYKAALLTYLLYKLVVDIPYLCLANIIAGREIVPEFLQFNMTPEKVAAKAVELLSDPARLDSMRQELAAVKAALGDHGARKRAAQAILPLLQ